MSKLLETLDGMIAALSEATGAQTTAKTRVSPELLNMLALKNQYDKEVRELKSNTPRVRVKNDNVIKVYDVHISFENIEEWMHNHDTGFALSVSKKWFKVPKDVAEELPQDEEWRDIAIRIWNIAAELLTKYKKWASQYSDNDLAIIDLMCKTNDGRELGFLVSQHPKLLAATNTRPTKGTHSPIAVDLNRTLRRIAQEHCAAHGLDITGRQLPRRR